MSECRLSTQYRKFPCLCNRERSPFSAWVHFALAAAEGARRATGAAANGARREAARERRTVRGHLLRGNIFSRAIPRSSEPGISDIADDVAVRAAVFGCATLSHPRRTERPFRHLICDQDAPSMRLGRSSSARSARASCAAWFDSTNAPRARQPGAAWGRRADRSRPGRGCRRYEEQTSSETYGRDITSSIFSPIFSSRGQGCPRRAGGGSRHSERRGDGKSISMIAASLSSCYAGRGGKTKTEGLQYLEPMGNVLLGSPGELLTLRRHERVSTCGNMMRNEPAFRGPPTPCASKGDSVFIPGPDLASDGPPRSPWTGAARMAPVSEPTGIRDCPSTHANDHGTPAAQRAVPRQTESRAPSASAGRHAGRLLR